MKYSILLAVLFLHSISQVFSIQTSKSTNIQEILLPEQTRADHSSSMFTTQVAQNSNWDEFKQKHGDWTIFFDKVTGKAHKAYGEAIKLHGFNQISEGNIKQAARSFLQDNATTFQINLNNLKLVDAVEANHRWYVKYRQVYKGIDVLMSEVSLVIFENGNLMSFGIEYYDDINISTEVKIGTQSANQKATFQLDNVLSSSSLNEKKAFILPIKDQNSITYKVVTQHLVETKDNSYTVYVDGHDGSVVWRTSNFHKMESQIKSEGYINLLLPTEKETLHPFAYQEYTINNSKHYADKNGALKIDIATNKNYSTTFKSPWVEIINLWKTLAKRSGTLKPGDKTILTWNNTNSHRFERNLFFHTNLVHDYIKSLDPKCNAMDFPIKISLQKSTNTTSLPNAFYNRTSNSIGFISLANPRYQMAGSGDVLYHEYGHATNHNFYVKRGKLSGMINKATHEAHADLMSAFIRNSSKMGLGYDKQILSKTIRDISILRKYPEHITGQSHNDGKILSGAFWDLYKLTDLETARRLAHFAKYTTPDDPNTGIAFFEWFIATIEADDDDGNIGNGTPHFEEIIKAFNKHNIGEYLLNENLFVHTPLKNTSNVSTPYNVVCKCLSDKYKIRKIDTFELIYKIGTEEKNILLTSASDNDFLGNIPAQNKGTIVNYRFKLKYKDSNTEIFYPKDKSYFMFLVGYETWVHEDFEQSSGWTTPSSQTGGQWEIGIPQKSQAYIYLFQTNVPVNPSSKKCLVTDARGAIGKYSTSIKYSLNAVSKAESPVYDFTSIKDPILSFHMWSYTYKYGKLTINISTNDGATWNKLKDITQFNSAWELQQIIIPSQYTNSAQTKFQFYANGRDKNYSSRLELLVDEFKVLSSVKDISVDANLRKNINPEIYPNPASETSIISYILPFATNTKLAIFDLFGKEIIVLCNEYQPASTYKSSWNLNDSYGNRVPKGIYFYKLQIGNQIYTRKVIVQ